MTNQSLCVIALRILKLIWISESAKEAELVLSDGTFQCLAFSHPCNVVQGQMLSEPLHAMDVKNLMIVIDENLNENIVKIDDCYFSHYCIAKVRDMKNSIVTIGDISIKIEGFIPRWAEEGDLIEFKCGRLDIW